MYKGSTVVAVDLFNIFPPLNVPYNNGTLKAYIFTKMWYNMGSEKLEKTIWELVSRHISIYDEMEWNSMCSASFSRQLDFLEFWVDSKSIEKYNPWKDIDWNITPPRDNPNMELTEYENVYRKVSLKSIDYEYSADWRAPVSILQWYRAENQHTQWWKISIYGKWLRLYYNWLLPRLPEYVERYAGEMIRADICWDKQWEKIPAGVVDLKCMMTIPDDNTWTYKMFWNGDLTCRIYDKSLDLMKKDRGIHSWLYPDWYKANTWRVEFVFKWKYAKSISASQWLLQCPTDWKIKPINYSQLDRWYRNMITTLNALLNLIEETTFTIQQQMSLFIHVIELAQRKLEKYKKKYKDLQ